MAPWSETIRAVAGWSPASIINGLGELWRQTRGEPQIKIAILDGPVDRSHPSLRGADLTPVETLVPAVADDGPATRHGTAVASLIFGQHEGSVQGVAPGCCGFVLPIFESADASSFRICSQLDLARALLQAAQLGVHLINLSSGQFAPSGAAHPLLANAVQECARRGILIIAAAGNEGCDCLHVPAALDTVLAAGAMDSRGEPLSYSNWGAAYQHQGILAPGQDLVAAVPGSGTARHSGTSYATALVTGVAALLLSLQHRHGRRPDPPAVREALLRSAIGCATQPVADCRHLLAGRLNVRGAVSLLTRGKPIMSESVTLQSNGHESTGPNPPAAPAAPASMPDLPPAADSVAPSGVTPSACSCQGTAAPRPQLVYALGQIGFDFVNEARLDSLVQTIGAPEGANLAQRALGIPVQQFLAHLDRNPAEAASVEWTLTLYGHPVYAIRPLGPFAAAIYEQLRGFLRDQATPDLARRVERVSIPGIILGKTTLLMGQVVPVIMPELRGMFSWNTGALVDATVGPAPAPPAPPTRPARETAAQRRAREQQEAIEAQEAADRYERQRAAVRNFLDRVYHEVHNLGTLPKDRALNHAATNALTVAQIARDAIGEEMALESFNVVPSAVCRPGSDCWDVDLYFFYPERPVQTVRRLYRFTVDVSDVVPVTVGPVRTWFTR